MPRNSSGDYSLPAGNPVASGQPISSVWANTTFADVANSITESLDRQGRGGMLAPLKSVNGTEASPAVTFTSETNSGLYWAGLNDVRFSLRSVDLFRWYDNNLGERNAQINTDTGFKNVLYEGSIDSLPTATADKQLLVWNDTTQIWVTDYSASDDVTYNNAISGLSANNVKTALDELAAAVGGSGTVPSGTLTNQILRWNNVSGLWVADFQESVYVQYDNATSGLTASNVKAALDELAAGGTGGGDLPTATADGQQVVWSTAATAWQAKDAAAINISYNNTGTSLSSVTVNAAINELDSKVLGDGTVDGQMGRWEQSSTSWLPTSSLVINDNGDALFSGNVLFGSTGFGFSGDGGVIATYIGFTEKMRVTSNSVGFGTLTPATASTIDVNGDIYTKGIPLVTGAERFVVTNSLPDPSDPDTIYFLI
jgi:hypothetical protein